MHFSFVEVGLLGGSAENHRERTGAVPSRVEDRD
jgi:hypothetical protein